MSLETTNIKQQLEILYQEVLRIERSGGGGGTSISSSSQNPADLDNYKAPGHYSISSASTAATITNTPFTQAGYVLEILPSYQSLSGTTGVIQKATTYTSNATSIKIRWYLYVSGTGWTWTQWETIH